MLKGTTSLDSPAHYLTQHALLKYLSGHPMDLLSAGLFLRMATEARLLQYKNSRKDFPKGPRAYKTKIWKNEIEKKFQTKNQIVEWDWESGKLYYIPVSDRQELLSSKLGNWLHFEQDHFEKLEQYIEEARPLVKELLELCMLCCCGNLLGPPLPTENGEPSKKFVLHIPQEDLDYVNELPDERQNRLNEFVPKLFSGDRFHLIHKLPDEFRIQKLKRYFGIDRLPS